MRFKLPAFLLWLICSLLIVDGTVLGADSTGMICGETELLEVGEEETDENENPMSLFAGRETETGEGSSKWRKDPSGGFGGGITGLELLRRYCRLLI